MVRELGGQWLGLGSLWGFWPLTVLTSIVHQLIFLASIFVAINLCQGSIVGRIVDLGLTDPNDIVTDKLSKGGARGIASLRIGSIELHDEALDHGFFSPLWCSQMTNKVGTVSCKSEQEGVDLCHLAFAAVIWKVLCKQEAFLLLAARGDLVVDVQEVCDRFCPHFESRGSPRGLHFRGVRSIHCLTRRITDDVIAAPGPGRWRLWGLVTCFAAFAQDLQFGLSLSFCYLGSLGL